MERESKAEKPYPYAGPKTFEFLKAAIAEGAHLETPKYQNDQRWAQLRNLAGIYFSTDLNLDEMGLMYGYTGENKRAGPHQQINKFLDLLWKNSSEELRLRFPRNSLSLKKPPGFKAARKIEEGIESADLTYGPLRKTATNLGVSLYNLTRYVRDRGIVPGLDGELKRLKDNPDDLAGMVKFSKMVGIQYIDARPDDFVRFWDVLKSAGISTGSWNHKRILQFLALKGIVTLIKWGGASKGRKGYKNYLFRVQAEKAEQVLRENAEFLMENLRKSKSIIIPEDFDEGQKVTESLSLRAVQTSGLFISASKVLRKMADFHSSATSAFVEALKGKVRMKVVPPRKRVQNKDRVYSLHYLLKQDLEKVGVDGLMEIVNAIGEKATFKSGKTQLK